MGVVEGDRAVGGRQRGAEVKARGVGEKGAGGDAGAGFAAAVDDHAAGRAHDGRRGFVEDGPAGVGDLGGVGGGVHLGEEDEAFGVVDIEGDGEEGAEAGAGFGFGLVG